MLLEQRRFEMRSASLMIQCAHCPDCPRQLVRILKTFHLGDPDRTASGWLSYVTELYDMSEPMSKFVGALTGM